MKKNLEYHINDFFISSTHWNDVIWDILGSIKYITKFGFTSFPFLFKYGYQNINIPCVALMVFPVDSTGL